MIAETLGLWLAIPASIAIFVYLLAALLRPDQF